MDPWFKGWGYLNENSTEHASILQEVQVPLQEMLISHLVSPDRLIDRGTTMIGQLKKE